LHLSECFWRAGFGMEIVYQKYQGDDRKKGAYLPLVRH